MKLKSINGRPRNAYPKVMSRSQSYGFLSWLLFEHQTWVEWCKVRHQFINH